MSRSQDSSDTGNADRPSAALVLPPYKWDGRPSLATFFIPLPAPLGLPPGATYTFDRSERLPWSMDVELLPQVGVPPMPGRQTNASFVSLKLWQMPVPEQRPTGPVDQAIKVAQSVMGVGQLSQQRAVSSAKRPPAGERDTSTHFVVTVVEAITPLLTLPDDQLDPLSAAFNRCLEELDQVVRAAFVITGDPRIHVLSRQSLYPIIPCGLRDPFDVMKWGTPMLFQLSFNAPMGDRVVPLGERDVQGVAELLSRMKRRDPFVVFLEWRRLVSQAFDADGNMAATLIAAHTASQVLLDSVLLFAAWEEGTSRAETREWFDQGFAKRLRTYYAPRFGGSWDPTLVTSSVGKWELAVNRVRGRVVHAGYRPTTAEGRAAVEATTLLQNFVVDRVYAKRMVYMRLAMHAVGHASLRQRGAWTGQLKRFYETEARKERPWLEQYHDWLDS